jgi:protein gp37
LGDTSIQWTDKTWNPVRGCSRVSEGCRHCYAERQAARFSGPHRPFDGFVRIQTGIGPQWTGKVELVESHLTDPLSWKKPQRVFVNSMSDLFHEALLDEEIDRVFAVMSQSPQHTFQVLTKRPWRMLQWFQYENDKRVRQDYVDDAAGTFGWCHANVDGRWPLPNVWLGVSVEDQKTADDRIPLLLSTPAAVRFISYEPALGPVDLWRYVGRGRPRNGGPMVNLLRPWEEPRYQPGIDWVIVGGESGPGARPFDIAWARDIIAQCKTAGVACFIKQLGARAFVGHSYHKQIHHRSTDGNLYLKLKDGKGGDMEEWREDLRVRQFPGTANEQPPEATQHAGGE